MLGSVDFLRIDQVTELVFQSVEFRKSVLGLFGRQLGNQGVLRFDFNQVPRESVCIFDLRFIVPPLLNFSLIHHHQFLEFQIRLHSVFLIQIQFFLQVFPGNGRVNRTRSKRIGTNFSLFLALGSRMLRHWHILLKLRLHFLELGCLHVLRLGTAHWLLLLFLDWM